MNPVQHSVERIARLIGLEIGENGKKALVSALGIFGIFMAISMLSWLANNGRQVSGEEYSLFTIIFGLALTGSSFTRQRGSATHIEYLLRPAYTFEKMLSKIAVTALGYWLLMSLLYILSLIVLYVAALIIGVEGTHFPPQLGKLLLDTLYIYLPVNALFLFGSVYFEKNSIGKVLLSMAVFALALVVLSGFAGRVIFAPYFQNPDAFNQVQTVIEQQAGDDPEQFFVAVFGFSPVLIYTLRHVLTTLWILGLWTLSWLRLRETEA